MKINGNISTDYGDLSSWNFGTDNLCLRAGTQGFICKSADWKDFSFFPDNSNDPEYFKPIDPKMDLCLRVFVKDLGDFKIPQLSLYTPELGYPLCAPDKTSYFRTGGMNHIRNRFFFTIPMLHVNYGLAFKRLSNTYTVFFSNAWDVQTPFSNSSKMTIIRGKYSTFPTGKNVLDTNTLYNNPATWPVDDIEDTNNLELDTYFVSGTGAQDPMPKDAFDRYLAYWLLYYPVILKKVRGYVAGSAGDIYGAIQGYFKYLSPKEDAFSGQGQVWRNYFGIKRKYNLLKGSSTKWLTHNWNYKSNRGFDYQLQYTSISPELWQEMAVIRAAITKSKLKKKFTAFPFSSRPKNVDFGRTKIHEADIKKLSLIIQAAHKMSSWSKVEVVDGKKCPMCLGELLLPKVLASNIYNTNIMCISCGYKALNNMHYLACKNISPLADNCMWFSEIDMDEVIGERAKIKVGANSKQTLCNT